MSKKIISIFIGLASVIFAHADDGSYDFIPFLPEWVNMLLFFVGIIAGPVLVIVLFVGMYKKVFSTIWYVISLQPLRRKLLRNKISRQLDYFRDVPADGNLKVAANVMNSVSSALVADYEGMFGALILRLIDRDALRIEFRSNMYGAEPHTILYVGVWKASDKKNSENPQLNKDGEHLEHLFFKMMEGAAGSDRILQPREMRHYLRTHPDEPFIASLRTLTEAEKAAANKPVTAAQLLALKKFLLDVSLVGERDIKEMVLWKEYLIYATLFGIADKVCDSFTKIYPDYFKMNQMTGTRLSIVGNRSLVRYSNAVVEGLEKPALKNS